MVRTLSDTPVQLAVERLQQDRLQGVAVRTLSDTPVQLAVERLQQDRLQGVVVLGEHVDDGVQRVVAGRCHPLCFL